MSPAAPSREALLQAYQAARYVGLTEREFLREVKAGTFPPGAITEGKRVWAAAVLERIVMAFKVEGITRQEMREIHGAIKPSVYFIGMETAPYVKVGWARIVDVRLATLQTANPERLILLGSIPGNLQDEARLHVALAQHRSQGEWFRKGPWLDQVLEALSVAGNVDAILKRLGAE